MTKPVALSCTVLFAAGLAVGQPEPRDLHAHMIEANRAQIVMLAARGLVPAEQATRIAGALRTAAAEQNAPGVARSANYLDLESRLAELIGPDASNLHLGRSRNDLGAAMNRMLMREMLLDHMDRIAAVRAILHRLSGEHLETVMPGFTHAVQAQPTTMAHFLLAFDASLQRDAQRLREVYARLNCSPLGSGAFTTSGFALDRGLLAELLGFQGLVENSYDAIMVSTADSKVEFASALGISALNIGRFVQYIIFQYDDPVPGMLLTGPITSRSSTMPQKRNPSAIERLRLSASEVVANAHASALFIHNTPMYEVKDVREDHLLRLERFAREASQMYEQLARVLESLTIRKEVLRDQVDRDYSTMTELADTLLREAGVPFRTGYKVASELTTYGRERGKRPLDLTHKEVADVYRRVTGKPLPLSAAQLRRAFDPAEIIRSRKGRGGPQPAETGRMLEEQRRAAAESQAWVDAERLRRRHVSDDLRRRFDALAGGRP
ncbi:MAG: argininosuccinate lyase [Acidobacteriota bacterium]|nr:argininosuccinate lyase [Acidobacteriota bacterium]